MEKGEEESTGDMRIKRRKRRRGGEKEEAEEGEGEE